MDENLSLGNIFSQPISANRFFMSQLQMNLKRVSPVSSEADIRNFSNKEVVGGSVLTSSLDTPPNEV